jgi:ABC-type Na+ efflux pump permease subunit
MCFRLLLNQTCDIPLPPGEMHRVAYLNQAMQADMATPNGPADPNPNALGSTNVAPRPAAVDDDIDMAQVNHSSVAWGLTGAVFMLLIYLGIRCSGFLASAVTGERERRSWEDLALTSQDPSEAMAGKVIGTLLLPVVQMSAMFPLLFFFVFNGSLSVVEVGFLYAYAVALAVGAGLLGLWSSTVSGASHEAHARALLLGVVSYLVIPAFMPLAALFSIAALGRSFYGVARRDAGSVNLAWAGAGVSLMLLPAAASPLTAVLTFMPSLAAAASAAGHFFHPVAGAADPFVGFFASMLFLSSLCFLMWHGVLARLREPGQEHGLRTQFANAT